MITEAEICDVALAKLKADGWKVACEVQGIDIIAQRDGVLMACEAKRGFCDKLAHQLYRATVKAHRVLAIVGTAPKSHRRQWLRDQRIGLWVVRDGEVFEELPCGKQVPPQWYVERIKSYADAQHAAWPDARAGLPGGGFQPAQDVQRRVDAFRAANPDATWKQIFAAVPSHYLSHTAMCSALRSNAKLLAMRALRQSETTPNL